MLQSGRSFDADGLALGLTVSRRTLFRDLNMLEAAGVPYHYDKKSKQYRINKDYFLPPINLTVGEALAVMLLTRRMNTRKMHPEYAQAVEAAQKIEAAIPGRIRAHCGSILENIEVKFWPMSDVEGISDINTTLIKAMVESRRVAMRYDSYFEGRVIEDVIHPYKRIFVNRGWYLVGYSEKEKTTRTYKLERIEKLTICEQVFEPDPGFSLENYFGYAWQMIREDRRYHVKIRFAPKVAGNVDEVLWHRSQRTQRQGDGSMIFEVDVDGIGEISWWVMGYGDQALVLEPPELRDLIIERSRSLLAQYKEAETSNSDQS